MSFDGGAEWADSSSPQVMPLPSDALAADPEEGCDAFLSSCEMLLLPAIAVERGFCVDRHSDAVDGTMANQV